MATVALIRKYKSELTVFIAVLWFLWIKNSPDEKLPKTYKEAHYWGPKILKGKSN